MITLHNCKTYVTEKGVAYASSDGVSLKVMGDASTLPRGGATYDLYGVPVFDNFGKLAIVPCQVTEK